MKYLYTILTLVFILGVANAQKIDYKNNVISVDGKEIAKVNKIKNQETMGFANTFEIYSMSGKKLIIAAYASEYDRDHSTNMSFYYRFTFLITDQVGIFSVSKLGGEKSFAKMIAASGVIVNDDLDAAKVKEFIAMQGKDPAITVASDDYVLAKRDRGWPVNLKEDKTIEQTKVTIGSFKDVTGADNYDTYEIILPSGIIAAKFSFTGGNNTQSFDLFTMKDRIRRTVNIQAGKVFLASSEDDRNQVALARIIKWLVANNYL
jgi:hypothetical protein